MFLKEDERKHGEVQAPAKVLKLSEAIRIGARMMPQCAGILCDGVGVCAIGAAAVGRGWPPKRFWEEGEMDKFLPEFVGDQHHMGNPKSLFAKIGNRNDEGESRESIADWLEGQGY